MAKVLSNRQGQLTRRIVACYRRASADAHAYGDEWYSAAFTFSTGLSERYGITVRQAVGVVAALSPSCAWDRNMLLADELLRTGDCSHMYGDAIRKARRIAAGEDPLDVLGGDKVRSFFHNILEWQTSEHVTVDRHAFDIAMGRETSDRERKVLETGGRRVADVCGEHTTGSYQLLADAYRSAARILGVRPHQVQAVTWCQWRAEKGLT